MPHAASRQAVSIARAALRSRPGLLPSLPRRFLSSPPQNSNSSNTTTNSSSSQENHSSGNSQHNNHSNPPRQNANIKFLPFVAIIAVGSAAYVALVNRRKAFSPDKATVVFVLGGPGAGKGTQCARLVDQYAFTHLSAGDLLRAEQDRPGSQFGDLIRSHIKDGLIVPMEVTVQLLENAMAEAMKRPGPRPARFLIDGFPRKLDQAYRFEGSVCEPSLVLFYDCPESVLRDRLLERGKTSGRADDNAESILKRFRTFVETSMPVVDHYNKRGAVVKIDATRDKDAVFADTQKRLKEKLGNDF
ncbi:hypothetical protein CDD80_3329 [Ophiocordyceps camponoti-rufipedis]|uniref:Uridylate kinase n=1 Tax=Ophiocordyceps camponoti-rufipedis TaxID=2004952 RepID=A0A2C5Z245_9HYPO|nr:hypothetical protein CDD80_3329 [Ophiocordyceps camponoti-rufipedis]